MNSVPTSFHKLIFQKCTIRYISNTFIAFKKQYPSFTNPIIKNNTRNFAYSQKNSLIDKIDRCVFALDDHYRKKRYDKFNEGLLELKLYCSQLNNETEGRLSQYLWNILIQQFCRSEDFSHDASFWFRRIMKEKKLVSPNAFTLSAILKSFSSIVGVQNFEMCEEIMKDLDDQGRSNVFSYIYYTKACILNGKSEKAFHIIERMENLNIEPNFGIFIPLLKEATLQSNKEIGLKICDKIRKSNLSSPQLSSTIATFALKVKQPDLAIEELEKLKQKGLMDIVTWTCLIQTYIQKNEIMKAISTLQVMKVHNISPDAATFAILLGACAKSRMYNEGVEIHQQAKKELNEFTKSLSVAIINFYTKCEKAERAIEECEKLKMKGMMSVITWTCLIQAHIQQNDMERAIFTLEEMKMSGVNPNSTTFTILLSACAKLNLKSEGLEIYEIAKRTVKEEFSSELYNSLINFYAKCGHATLAVEECEKLKIKGIMYRNIVAWNCLIQAHIQLNNIKEAICTISEMRKYNSLPDSATFTILLSACAKYNLYNEGIEIQTLANHTLKEFTLEFYNSVVNFYTKCGHAEIAIEECEKLKQKGLMDIVTWTCLIQAYIDSSQQDNSFEEYGFNKAVKTYQEMKGQNIVPDTKIFSLLLASCGKYVASEIGSQIIEDIKQNGLDNNEEIISGMIYFYSRICKQEISQQLFDNLVLKKEAISIHTYTTMISCYAQHGKGRFEEAEKLIGSRNDIELWGTLLGGCRKFYNIEQGEKVFNKITSIDENATSPYILLLNIYSYRGLDEKVIELKEIMKKRKISKSPGIVYYEEHGTVFKFVSESNNFQISEQIEKKRNEIFSKIVKVGYKPDTSCVTRTEPLSEEEKINLLLRHAEKTAISHAFVLNPNRKRILLTGDLRVCSDCHSAIGYISKVMDVESMIRDSNRYHHFKDGKCSCGEYW